MERWRHRCKGQGVNERNKRLGWLKRRRWDQMGIQRQITQGHVNTFGPGLGGHGDKRRAASNQLICFIIFRRKLISANKGNTCSVQKTCLASCLCCQRPVVLWHTLLGMAPSALPEFPVSQYLSRRGGDLILNSSLNSCLQVAES